MTKEQEDSIEILENTDISTIELAENTDLYTYSLAVRTVLNMLKEKDTEIEKKDKMIDLIIDFFYKLTQESPGTTIHYLEKNGFDTSKCNNCSPGNDCRKCFKQYFERKAKDGRL